jgi:hypothetical protein
VAEGQISHPDGGELSFSRGPVLAPRLLLMHFASANGLCSGAMTNRFGVVLHTESLRWAAAEGVSETVIAAVLLLHERSVEEIVAKLGAVELEQVIKLVGRSPRLYPLGTLDALKQRKTLVSPPPSDSVPSNISAKKQGGRPQHSADRPRGHSPNRPRRRHIRTPARLGGSPSPIQGANGPSSSGTGLSIHYVGVLSAYSLGSTNGVPASVAPDYCTPRGSIDAEQRVTSASATRSCRMT